MDDLISRQAAIDAILAINDYGNSDRANALGLAEFSITTLPSAQPERKGRWMRYGEDGYPNEKDTVVWQCDQCLTTYYGRTERIANYCPNCGASMTEGADDV